MQSLIPLFLAVSLSSGAQLNLLPYAYLSNSLPVYHQYQNTRTGEHAFSYAGGPSAKEEIKDANGVLRGSYSYIDANGILQSVFYVADDNGFRVAATNLPSDDNLNTESAHIVLARSVDGEEKPRSSRRRRSLLEDSIENDQRQQERAEDIQKEAPLQPLLLTSGIPLATSHQSQVQVHNNARLDFTGVEVGAKPVDLEPILPVQITDTISGNLPVFARAPTYHENRIELHKELGIEGPQPKDAVKIDSEPLTIVQTPSFHVLPVASTVIARGALPIYSKEAVPVYSAAQIGSASVTTSISSHGLSQIHGPSKIAKEAVAVPAVVAKEAVLPVVPIVKEAPKLASATVTTSISSHGISQIHGDSKVNIEPTLLVKTAQLHPLINVPIYLH